MGPKPAQDASVTEYGHSDVDAPKDNMTTGDGLGDAKKEDAWGGWTSEYVMRETLLGCTIGFAQIPESVAFAYLANIKPPIALHAAWMVGLICSLFGGRPAMVNGATGAFAAIISTFLPEPKEKGGNGEGVELLFPSVILAGFIVAALGFLNVQKFILLLPTPVMTGFCNGLAVVIGMAQLHPFEGKPMEELLPMIGIALASMVIMEFLPKIPCKIFKVIPSSLMSIIAAIALEFALIRPIGYRTDTIRDVSEFTSDTAYPWPFFVEHSAYNYDLSKITESMDAVKTIGLQGLLLATVCCIEDLMTSEVVESYCKTPSDGRKTLVSAGVANAVSGFFGGMGGNAMIGLSTINVLNGGRGRLAPTVTALLVMIAVMGAYPILNYIPVAALAGIMLVVVLHTFQWRSLSMVLNCLPKTARESLGLRSKKIPRIEVVVIFTVMIVSKVFNIAYGVFLGVAICAIGYAWNQAGELQVTTTFEEDKKVYRVDGPLFFAAANRLVKMLDADVDPDSVEVVFGHSSIMDYTAVATLQKISMSYKAKDKSIVFKSLNEGSQKMINKSKCLADAVTWEARQSKPELLSCTSLPDVFAGATQLAVGLVRQVSNGSKDLASGVKRQVSGGEHQGTPPLGPSGLLRQLSGGGKSPSLHPKKEEDPEERQKIMVKI